MKTQINEIKRMQQLAGIINENQWTSIPIPNTNDDELDKTNIPKSNLVIDEWSLVDEEFIDDDDVDEFHGYLDMMMKKDKTLRINQDQIPRIVDMFNSFLKKKEYNWQVLTLTGVSDGIFTWKIA